MNEKELKWQLAEYHTCSYTVKREPQTHSLMTAFVPFFSNLMNISKCTLCREDLFITSTYYVSTKSGNHR